MKFLTATLALAITGMVSAFNMEITYEPQYDNPAGSLTTAACSDGANGMITKGFPVFGSIPRWPYIASSGLISGWNSQNCGSCIAITYEGKIIYATLIDMMPAGVDLSLAAMNDLTNGQAEFLGRVTADVQQVEGSQCGL